MLKAKTSAYRLCEACSSPVRLNEETCSYCGHSFSMQSADKEREQILRGRVFYNGKWMAIEEKARLEKFVEEQLAAGKVEHHGNWISIEEKLGALKSLPKKELDKVVDFPLKSFYPDTSAASIVSVTPLSSEATEETAGFFQKKHRMILIAAFSAISLLTMLFAAYGIFFSR